MEVTTVQRVKELVAKMNLDRDGNGELVLRQAQILNLRHVRLQLPLVRCLREAPDGRGERHPPSQETDAHPPDDIKMQSGDGGNRGPRATVNEDRSFNVELPSLGVQAGFMHRCYGVEQEQTRKIEVRELSAEQ